MSLAARLEEAVIKSDPFLLWLSSLDAEDVAALEKYAADDRLSTKKLAGIIREFGGKIGEERLSEYRRGHGWIG